MVEQIKKPQKTAPNIFTLMAKKYHLDPDKFLQIIKSTVMKPSKDGREATMEEIAAFLIVSHKYNLDPFTKEIYAFPSKRGGVVPIVSIDGFLSIMNRHPDYDGMDVPHYSEDEATMDGAKPCPTWCEVTLYRKNFQKPITVREYLDEVYITAEAKGGFPGPWQTHTKRMLRHKTIEQAARIAFGITGIYTPDEAQRIIETEMIENGSIKPDVATPEAITDKSQEVKPETPTVKFSTEAQQKAIHTLGTKIYGKDQEKFINRMGRDYGVEHTKELTLEQASKLIETLLKELNGK